jgi:hypothetical protein
VRAIVDAAAKLDRARQKVAVADADLRAAVTQARRAGASWSDVGEVLGVTRQSAQQRFGRVTVPLDQEPEPEPPAPTLTRQQRRALERRKAR